MRRLLIIFFQFVTVLLISALFILNLALPHFVSEELKNHLQQQGARQISLGDMDVNLFTGKVSVHQLRFVDSNAVSTHITYGSASLSYWALLFKQLEFSRINLYQSQLAVIVTENDISVAGLKFPLSPADSNTQNAWPILFSHIDGRSIQLHLQLYQQTYDLQLHRLDIQQDDEGQADIEIAIQHDDAQVRAKGLVSWQPEIQLDLAVETQRLALHNYMRYIPMPDTLHLEGIFDSELQLRYQTNEIQLQGTLNSQEMTLLMPGNLTLFAGNARWQGQFLYSQQQDWQLLGDLELQQAFLQDEFRQFRYIRTDNITAEELSLHGTGKISAPRILAQHVDLLGRADSPGRKAYLLSADQILLDQISLQDLNVLDIREATADAATLRISINKDGAIQELQSDTIDIATADKSKPTDETNPSTPFVYRINQLSLTNDSRLQFTDNSITPSFILLARPLDLQVTNIDSTLEQQGNLKLASSLNRFSNLSIQGDLHVLAPGKNTQLDVTLESFDLPSLSGYSAKFGNFNIKRGILNAESQVRIEQKKLHIDNQISINNFALENLLQQQQQNEELGHVGMPLNQALVLLRNKDGDVKFNLPVRGDLDKPDFSFRDITRQAVKSASEGAAVIVLQQFLQPWSSIFTLAKLTIGQISTTRLQAVTFAPNSKQLSTDMQAYVKRLSELLQQKTELRLEICGISSKREETEILQKNAQFSQEQLNQALLKLADQRSQLIKQTLVEQYQINPNRLFACQSRIDTSKKATPRAELGL